MGGSGQLAVLTSHPPTVRNQAGPGRARRVRGPSPSGCDPPSAAQLLGTVAARQLPIHAIMRTSKLLLFILLLSSPQLL